MAELGGLIYVVYAASSLATGWLSDRWMAPGGRATPWCARPSHGHRQPRVPAPRLLARPSATGHLGDRQPVRRRGRLRLQHPDLFAIGQTLAGPRAAGKWIGFQNCMGNLAGIVAPIITGFVVDATGNFTSAFIIASLVGLGGVVAWGLVIRKVAPLEWS